MPYQEEASIFGASTEPNGCIRMYFQLRAPKSIEMSFGTRLIDICNQVPSRCLLENSPAVMLFPKCMTLTALDRHFSSPRPRFGLGLVWDLDVPYRKQEGNGWR